MLCLEAFKTKNTVLSRREFARAASALSLATFPRFAEGGRIDSTIRGVKIGITSGSLNPLPEIPGKDRLDTIIEQCVQLGVGNVELASGFLGPSVKGTVGGQAPKVITPEYQQSREALRQWRLSPSSIDEFRLVRKKVGRAGIDLFSMSNTVADDATDEEIDMMFRQMQALNIRIFHTNQSRVSVGPRLVPFAKKYKIYPAFHTHAEVDDPNEIASVESLAKLLALSDDFKVCLDLGHFTAGNNDAVAYIKEHHARITHVHVKDRKRNKGPNVEWGTGDTPIAESLVLIRDRQYPIRCIMEREFKGTGTALEETRKDFNYMKRVLMG